MFSLCREGKLAFAKLRREMSVEKKQTINIASLSANYK